MRITYSAHARDRMREQKVSEGDVEAALAHPDTDASARFGRRNAYKMTQGWLLRITYAFEHGDIEGGDPYDIVTVVITVYAEQRA